MAKNQASLRLACALTCALAAAGAGAATVELRVVAINDFHGSLEPVNGEGGAVALASTLESLRTTRTVFVSSGDLIGASPLPSALAHDEPTLTLFKHLGLQANAIGNHELDGGLKELQRQETLAGFPFLSANLVDSSTGKPVFAPYRIVEVDGVRVAFVGATVRNALKPLEPDSVPGLRIDDEAEALNAQAALLRAQGVHALIALLHEGAGAQGAVVNADGCASLAGPARAITEKLDPDYDLVLSAHTHALYACRVGQRWLLQGGANGRFLSVADLMIDRQGGEVFRVGVRNVAVTPTSTPDPAVLKLVDDAVAAAAVTANRVVASLGASSLSAKGELGSGSPLGVMVANAQARAGAAFGAQFACTNSSSVPRDLVASVDGDKVTYADVRAVQPYGNHLKVLEVSGAQLRALLEQQWREGAEPAMLSCSRGLQYAYDGEHRIRGENLRFQTRPVDDADQFTMVANSYLARGGQGFTTLAGIAPVADAGLDLDALLAWLDMPKSPERCRLQARHGQLVSTCADLGQPEVTTRVWKYLSRHEIDYQHALAPAQVADALRMLDEILAAADEGRDLGVDLPDYARKQWKQTPLDVRIDDFRRGVTLTWWVGRGLGYEATRGQDGNVHLSSRIQ